MIQVDIQKNLGTFQLNIHFQSESRRIGILGPSGCGKSMTLRSIAGVERPDSGRILVDGQVMFDSNRHINVKPQKRGIGYLFQNYALFPTMTVAENIGAGLKGTSGQKKEQVACMVERFQLVGLEHHLPGQLSGGQQQRAALARIMAYQPEVLLLDEPFSALDDHLKEHLQQEMAELLKDYGGTVILVSHSRDEIYRFCQELVIMDGGYDICHGRTEAIFRKPRYIRAAQLTGCKNIVEMKRLDEHHASVPEWGFLLKTRQEIPADTTHLGIRAHDFVPLWEEPPFDPGRAEPGSRPVDGVPQAGPGSRPVNCIPVQIRSMARLPFEDRYYLQGAEENMEICWFLQRDLQQAVAEKGLPRWLTVPEEKVLFLREKPFP